MKLEIKNQSVSERQRVGIHLSPDDFKYKYLLEPILRKYSNDYIFIYNPESACKYYISTSEDLLKTVVGERKVNLTNYSGSIVKSTLFLTSISLLGKVPHLPFLFNRFIFKLLYPEKVYIAPQFTWEIAKEETQDAILRFCSEATLIAIDIETPGRDLSISMCSYSAYNATTQETKTFAFEYNSMWSIKLQRLICDTNAIKIFQNGSYDITYLLRYSIIPKNYLLDTMGMMHAWYAELPKKLSDIAAFTTRNIEYWKDSANGDHQERLRYNARDAFATLHACISMLVEMPDWALKNFTISMPLQFPTLLMSLRGLKVDTDILAKAESEARETIDQTKASLAKMAGEYFNAGSPKQVLTLYHILGAKQLESSDAKATVKFSLMHPLNARIAKAITAYREAVKFHSNYATVLLLNGRLHYALNPWGTESGRFACKASHFNYNEHKDSLTPRVPNYINYGFQIQNAPPKAKRFIRADDGYEIQEIDYSQAESRTTGYCAKEPNLIYAVESSPDFHSYNASKFFGIPFEELWDTDKHKTKNKPIRDLSKRVNHGANYNMAETVLIETMGSENMWQAKKLLGLPARYDLKNIATHLLTGFCATYPRLKGTRYIKAKNHAEGVKFLIEDNTYYGDIIQEVRDTNRLTSVLGWTRWCFGNPMQAKPALNEYVAHVGQNLSVALINRAIMRIYWHPELRDFRTFKLNAQIHDSLLMQIKKGHAEVLNPIIKSLMNEPVEIHGKIMVIPFDISSLKTYWK